VVFCYYGFVCLSLVSSLLPPNHSHWDGTKAGSASKKNRQGQPTTSIKNEIINKKQNYYYSVGSKRHKSADSLAKGQQHTSNTFKAAAEYKRSQKAMTTGSAVFLFSLFFFHIIRWLFSMIVLFFVVFLVWFVSFRSCCWFVFSFFLFFLSWNLRMGMGWGFVFTSLPWRRLWVPSHRTRFAWFRPETCL